MAGRWLVYPVSPTENEYYVKYEIRDPANGALVRTIPP
jgi:hypothetical protein